MPELPEVELTRRFLDDAMTDHRMESVTVSHERTARYNTSPDEVGWRLSGRWVESIGRHGKFLVASLDDGQTMVAHLGMSGRFSITDPGDEVVPHTHVVFVLEGGSEVRFVDPRTFGFLAVYDEEELAVSPLSRLGPDAWDNPPSPDELARSLKGRTAPIKALLLDQRPIAGLGNIYADEVLHRAAIHPLRAGGRVGLAGAGRLLDSVRVVLGSAIDSGGTTLDDMAYLLPDGRAGENLARLAVYGRENLDCPRCGTPIRRVMVRTRSTHFCPSCQK